MKIIDLFAGCGGMSLGFKMAGFQSVWAVEKDEWASETYRFNHPKVEVFTGDITKIKSPKSIFSEKIEIDGIIGGPPCQGFSLSGNRDLKDPRNSLFMDFARFVAEFRPKFFVMENVKGILSMRTHTKTLVKDIICQEFEQIGYKITVFTLNAADYGVPQARQRVFFIGIRSDFKFDEKLLFPPIQLTAENQITLENAISDLPYIQSGEGAETQQYSVKPQNDYQKWVRMNTETIFNHVAMRHTPRLIERFKNIQFGMSVADVSPEHGQRKRGDATIVSGIVFSQNNMRPFPNKPAPTVAASFQSNFIHPFLNRNFTAREGARLQSFPDNYIFKGKRTTMSWEKNLSQYQQIGNAVPPLLAKAIGEKLVEYFKKLV
jgi:DNA (cytosine-5)-methyltransferase 1